jgi:hypothetical protein
LGGEHVHVNAPYPLGDGVLVVGVLALDEPALVGAELEPFRVVEGVVAVSPCSGSSRTTASMLARNLNLENRLLRLKVPTDTSIAPPQPTHISPSFPTRTVSGPSGGD